ncbi:DUF3077 domain-containing protein [Pseudomonas fragi]
MRVNSDIPLRHAWASHYLCIMGKAVIDDLCLREF